MNERPIGIHVSLWTEHWNDNLISPIEKASRLGFQLVELPIMDPLHFPVGHVKDALTAHGLQVCCGTGLNPTTDISSNDSFIREQGIAHLKKCLDIASTLGSASLEGVIHSSWGRQTRITQKERDNSTTALQAVADYAASLGMRLGLECINRYESSMINTARQCADFISRINRANVGIHLDTYHMNIEETSIPETLIEFRDQVFFLHLSENTRGYPGNGSLDWPGICKTLLDIEYMGPIVIESYIMPNCESGDDVKIWREIEPDSGKTLQESLHFLQHLFF